jgi:hypothetical protein
MKIQSIVLLIISIILVFVSSWNMSIFIRLTDVSPQYPNDDQFDTACHMSKKYVIIGKTTSIVILIISVILMIVSSIIIYHQNTL